MLYPALNLYFECSKYSTIKAHLCSLINSANIRHDQSTVGSPFICFFINA